MGKRNRRLILIVGFPLLLLMASAGAQDISEYYTVKHPEEFTIDWTSFYHTMIDGTAAVREEFPHHLNKAYGEHSKQQLDLYLPKGDVSQAPVFLFLHGGGFREGDRAQYGAVAKPFVNNGIITAVASYRLTGDGFHYPDQPNDVKHAIKWIYDNIGTYGGDPTQIFVGGHSAGAILSADVGVHRQWMKSMGMPAHALRGIVPISGPYDMRQEGRPGEQSAYAPTPELQEKASPILHVDDAVPAAIVAVGSLEEYTDSSMELTEKLEQAGSNAQYLELTDQDHDDTALSLVNESSRLFQRVLGMIEEQRSSR